MARGAFLTKEVRMQIMKIHDMHPDWGPTRIQEELLSILGDSGLDKKYGAKWPSVSAVAVFLKEIGERHHLDMPWSLASLIEHPISEEAMPAVLTACERNHPDNLAFGDERPLTIREALWMGRLRSVVDAELLLDWAYLYATEERFSEIRGEPFYTLRGLDLQLMNKPKWAKGAYDSRIWPDLLKRDYDYLQGGTQ